MSVVTVVWSTIVLGALQFVVKDKLLLDAVKDGA